MDWDSIKRKYPKSFDTLLTEMSLDFKYGILTDKYSAENFLITELYDFFYAHKIACIIDYTFMEGGYFIPKIYNEEQPQTYTWDKIRRYAEISLFYKAFEILEKKLNNPHN
jgi:hypothetical protein